MTWTISSSGTLAATISAASVALAIDTTNATYVAFADLSNMANADIVELTLKTKALSTSSVNLAWKGTYANTPLIINPQSPFLPSDQSAQFAFKQVGGTVSIASIAGTIPYGSSVSGLLSSATALVYPAGLSVSGSTLPLTMLTGTFSVNETIQLSAGNSFKLASIASGRNFDWKLMRQ